jgi:hypothetical protein
MIRAGMKASTAAQSSLGNSSGIQEDRDKVSSGLWLVSGALAVLFAYSLPFLLNRTRHRPFLNVTFQDEKMYLTRVVDAYRGGSLGNPYLAEHQNAVRFMPELAERFLASMAHVTRMDPLRIVAVSRVLFPLLIYALLWSIARGFGMGPRLATLAALLPPLRPTVFWAGTVGHDPGFFRYSRAISPAFYVLLLLVALRLVQFARRKPLWWTGLLVGASLGLLFYGASPYYWTFAIGGTAWIALAASGRVRTTLLTAVAAASIIGVPLFVKNLYLERAPDVQETLARLGLLVPGRSPDRDVTHTFIVAALVLVPVWLWRRKLGDSGRFLVPFVCLGTLLMVQNVVTNRHLDGWHWIDCLIPVWSLTAVAFVGNSGLPFRAGYLIALLIVLVSSAFFRQTTAYRWWTELAKENPETWAPDARMPRTLEWLNEHTLANSVVITKPDLMDLLVLFTHNKVYWAFYAGQHVVPEWEVEARTKSLESWHPGSAVELPFRTDFYLGTGSACLELDGTQFLYRNQSEATCVLSVSRRP